MQSPPAARKERFTGVISTSTTSNERQDDRIKAARPKSGVGQRGSVNETQRLQDDRKEAARPKSGVGQRGSVNERHRLLDDGGHRRPKSDASRSSTSAEGGTLHLQRETEMLRRIRNKLCEACEGRRAGTPSIPKDFKTSEEYLSDIETYADILMNHLDSKRRTTALSHVRTIYDPLWDWRSKLSDGKKAQLKTKPTNMSRETDIMTVLKEISVLQSELFMVIGQDEKELMLELQELDKDIQNDWKDNLDMNQADKMADGSKKSLRMIRLQLMQKQKQLKNTAQKEKDEDSATSKKLQKLKEQIRTMWGNVMKENEPHDISEALSTLENHITENKAELEKLSKVASADNNPNIADLSDQYRPTKLAEQFSELYDNDWTNAFEELKHLDDRKRITFLLEILVETYKCCKEISINHQKILMRALQIPTDCMEKTQKNAKDLKLSPVLSKTLSELKKQTADLSVDDVTRYLTTKHKEWFKMKQVGAYASKCIKLCWFMNVNSSPVCMVTIVNEGSKFDTDRYKYYTKTGQRLDYMVWPVLLLHEGGPLLCKGVAQGK